MCGICGYSSNKSLGKQLLKKMNDTIAYRGPNDEGYYIDNVEGKEIGLAHRRLSILDLSSLGKQPMISDDKNIVVVFNGEIYNFLEIKEELIKKGYIFNSTTDTEVIVNGYKEYGIDVIKKFNGMFAIAILDLRDKSLYLVRDHIGIKPLYYYYDKDNFIFGSELKPLMAYPEFKKEIDMNSLDTYLYHGYITGEKSIFKNTFKLLPGHYLKLKNNKVDIKEYWSVGESFKKREIKNFSEIEWKRRIKEHLENSIKDRMISDVPIGAFLSGGIDSSLVVSVMQSLSKEPIKTFTIGFKDAEYNEAQYAKKIAEYLGTDHTEYYLANEEIERFIKEIPLYYDEPFADSSEIPTMMVAKLASKKVRVALSGDGGDELFCGYSHYDNYKKLEKYLKVVKYLNKKKKKEHINKLNLKYTAILECNSKDNIINYGYLNFLSNESILKFNTKEKEKRYFLFNGLSDNIQEKGMIKDLITYLPDDIMTKVDRASMAFSLESRSPFIDDYKFIELSFCIPHDLKYRNKEKKYILKKLLLDYLPQKLIERPKKGFSLPIIKILRTELNYIIEEAFDEDFILKQGLFRIDDIKNIKKYFFKNKSYKNYKGNNIEKLVWNIIVFQLWYKFYIKK